jgi:lipoprotein-releasing system permease protein
VKLPFFIARRYFFSRKNPTAINIITFIGVVGYAVGSFALVALMSALNGFENIIFSVYESYYPDLKVTPVMGKVFDTDSTVMYRVSKIPGVQALTYVLEESAVIQNGDNQVVGLVKGVGTSYPQVIKADSLIVAGSMDIKPGGQAAWIAEGLYYKLNLGSENRNVKLMAPRRDGSGVSQMDMMETELGVAAIVKPGDEMEQKLVLTNLDVAQEVFEREGSASAMEIKLQNASVEPGVKEALKNTLGKDFDVRNRKEQNQAVYKMFNTEKWAAFAIMAFVLLIISFNLLGSLSMLVLEKKKDIGIMQTMGMPGSAIRRIFFSEGVMVAFVGASVGLVTGIATVLLQQKYGFVQTQATFAAAYPVELRMADVFLILALCFALGVSGAIYPAWKSSAKR